MTSRKRKDRKTIRRVVLTLRLTEEEMLRFKVSALGLKKKRSRIVRERVADLIGLGAVGAFPIMQQESVENVVKTGN